MISTVTPVDQAINVNYKIVVPGLVRKQYTYSPNTTPIQEQAKGFVDLSKVGELDTDISLGILSLLPCWVPVTIASLLLISLEML